LKQNDNAPTADRLVESKEHSYQTMVDMPTTDNSNLTTILDTVVIISDSPDHVNVVNVPIIRSSFTTETVEKFIDTKIWQLVTEGPLASRKPPMSLAITATNWHWITVDGTNVSDKWGGHDAFTPAGIASSGKYANPVNPVFLYATDEHALFLPHSVVNYIDKNNEPVLDGLTWEWKLDGNIVSTSPQFMLNNAESQGPKHSEVTTYKTLVCTVSNEFGSISETLKFLVADDVRYDGVHTKRARDGYWNAFDNSKFMAKSTTPWSKHYDPMTANRDITVKGITFNSYGSGHSAKSKFKKDPSDSRWVYEAQYRVDSGNWVKASSVFAGKSNSHRAYRFHDEPTDITWSAPGNSTTKFEFRYKYKFYSGAWPFRKKHTRTYHRIYDIQVPSDPNISYKTINNITIPYTSS